MLDTLLHQDLLKTRKGYYGFTLVIKCTITHNCSIQESQKNDSNAKKNYPIFAAIKNQTPVKSNFAFDMLWSSLAVEVLACTLITKFLIFCSSNMLLVHWATYMICHIVSNPVSNTKIGETDTTKCIINCPTGLKTEISLSNFLEICFNIFLHFCRFLIFL